MGESFKRCERELCIQKILGHKDIETTLNTYTTVFNKYKEEELEKLNNYITNF